MCTTAQSALWTSRVQCSLELYLAKVLKIKMNRIDFDCNIDMAHAIAARLGLRTLVIKVLVAERPAATYCDISLSSTSSSFTASGSAGAKVDNPY